MTQGFWEKQRLWDRLTNGFFAYALFGLVILISVALGGRAAGLVALGIITAASAGVVLRDRVRAARRDHDL